MIIILRTDSHLHLENCIFWFVDLKHELARSTALCESEVISCKT